MLIMDAPYAPMQEIPIVLVQAVTPDPAMQPDYLLKTCDEVQTADASATAMNTISPSDWLVNEVSQRQGETISADEFDALSATVRLTQLQDTEHGKLIRRFTSSGAEYYEYRSEPGYVGKDQAIFMAEFKGKRYKIVADVVVSKTINENSPQCPEPQLIKVRKRASNSKGYDSGYTLAYVSVTCGALGGATWGKTTARKTVVHVIGNHKCAEFLLLQE